MPTGLEIYNSLGERTFSSEEDVVFSILGSVVGNGTVTLPGSSYKYFHIVVNTSRLRDQLADDFTPAFNVVYNATYTQAQITAPAGVTTMIGYY